MPPVLQVLQRFMVQFEVRILYIIINEDLCRKNNNNSSAEASVSLPPCCYIFYMFFVQTKLNHLPQHPSSKASHRGYHRGPVQHAPMDDTVDDELVELPRPLTGRDVTLFLDPFGFHASTQMDWQKGALEQIRQMW